MKKGRLFIAGLTVLLITLAIVFVKVGTREPAIGNGPAKEMAVTLAWSGEAVQIPAPVRFPEWGKQTREFRRWRNKKDVRDFTAYDLQGCKYVAHGLGFSADPKDPQGKLMPDIHAVLRYGPDGARESETSYNFHGPSEWSLYDKYGYRTVRLGQIGIGLQVDFFDEDGGRCKEWSVNRRGQIYQESIKRDGRWMVTQDLRELKTDDDVPWADSLRDLMEYYPGREARRSM